ncbi:MAG: SGNH/GDSL hydrolase family protein [Clostridia bacterium]|nr:SGNH/GDSL hydrolase family protein [Clostridia bacterium]
MRILFQGDSITDAGRDRRNYRNLGNGYPKYTAELLTEAFPTADIDFINLGISGERTAGLFARLYNDAIALEPDSISVLIGINDVWHRHNADRVETTDEMVEINFRATLARLRAQTHARIVVMTPFLLDAADKESWRGEVEQVAEIVKRVAAEYADVIIPLDEIFANALKTAPEQCFYSPDGVHPNEAGARLIAGAYFDAVAPLVAECIEQSNSTL